MMQSYIKQRIDDPVVMNVYYITRVLPSRVTFLNHISSRRLRAIYSVFFYWRLDALVYIYI